MNLQDDRHRQRRRKTEGDREPPAEAPASGRRKRGASGEVGNALRSAYQRMVDEDIPPEMLDLLGKLG